MAQAMLRDLLGRVNGLLPQMQPIDYVQVSSWNNSAKILEEFDNFGPKFFLAPPKTAAFFSFLCFLCV